MAKLTFDVLKALNNAKYAKRIKPVVEPIIIKYDAYRILRYAHDIVRGPFPAGEKAIAYGVDRRGGLLVC